MPHRLFLTADIPWHVEDMAVSEDRSRAAFTVNENGFSKLYLIDLASQSIPAGGIHTDRAGR